MKRTPPLLALLAVGVQLAGLGLCVWAMSWHARAAYDEDTSDEGAPPKAEPPPPQGPKAASVPEITAAPPPGRPSWMPPIAERVEVPVVVATASIPPAPEVAAHHFEPEPEPVAAQPPLPARMTAIPLDVAQASPPPPAPAPPRAAVPPSAPSPQAAPTPPPAPAAPPVAAQPPTAATSAAPAPPRAAAPSVGPIFGAPPLRAATTEANATTPPFVLEIAERTTQIVRGATTGGWLVFGFYPDGNIRMVDIDAGQYEGRAASARADMKEKGGARSFTLQIGVAADGRLQATFAGGGHDGQTLVLEQSVERPVT